MASIFIHAYLTDLREFDPIKHVVGHRADPIKALPFVIAHSLSRHASKSAHNSLQLASPGKK